MDEIKAKAIAGAMGGAAHQSGGGIWLVILTTSDGRLVVISDDAIAEYRDRAAFNAGDATATIDL